MCFIADNQSLAAVFIKGKNYSQCPDDVSKTVLLLECAPGQDLEYSGSKGDITFELFFIVPDPLDGCVVCYRK